MLLSIDVGSANIYAAEGNYSSGAVTVTKAAQIALPGSTVEDGIIKNHAALAMAINKMIAAGNIVTGKTVFTFNSNSVLTRRLELPQSKPGELGKMVKNEMLQVVNETGEFVFEYSIVNESVDKKGLTPVWAYAMPREIVDEYYGIFKNLRMKPVALDIHSNSVEKLFSGAAVNGNAFGGRAVLFAGLEQDNAEIHLFSEGQRAFSRIAPVSVADLSVMIENSAASAVPPSLDGLDLNDPNIRANTLITETAQAYIGRLADEMQKMVQFQLRRDSSNPVSAVYLYGGVSGVGGLAAGLSSSLGIHAEQIGSISKVRYSGPVANYINAIGALIRL